MSKTRLKLIHSVEFSGYEYDDIINYLGGPKSMDAIDFAEWFSGQTGGMIGGKMVVYKWDWDRYKAGKKAFD